MLDLQQAEKIALENARNNLEALQNNNFEYFTQDDLYNMGYIADIKRPQALSKLKLYYSDNSMCLYTTSKQIVDSILNYINKLKNWKGVKS